VTTKGVISPLGDTQVIGRRVLQYVIDTVIVGLGVGAALSLFLAAPTTDSGAVDTSAATFWLAFIAVPAASIAWFMYVWVLHPYAHRGQSFGMQLLGIRVIAIDGETASRGQLFARALLLIIDTLVSGLVGLLTMIGSSRNQRLGDMAAKTIVVRAKP